MTPFERSPSRLLPHRQGKRQQLLVVAGICTVVALWLIGLGPQTQSATVSGSSNQFRHLSQASGSQVSAAASTSYPGEARTPLHRALFSALGGRSSSSSSSTRAGRATSLHQGSTAAEPSSYSPGPTLVVYAYSPEDPLHTAKFAYFMRWGMAASRDLEYLVAIRKQVRARDPA